MEDGFTSSLDARYDVTETMIDGGKARVYLHVLSGGTIQVNARTPANAGKCLPDVPASDKYKMPFTASP
jgi:hypothetical protein